MVQTWKCLALKLSQESRGKGKNASEGLRRKEGGSQLSQILIQQILKSSIFNASNEKLYWPDISISKEEFSEHLIIAASYLPTFMCNRASIELEIAISDWVSTMQHFDNFAIFNFLQSFSCRIVFLYTSLSHNQNNSITFGSPGGQIWVPRIPHTPAFLSIHHFKLG